MAPIHAKWNGNKYGELGDYGRWRCNEIDSVTAPGQKLYRGGTYQATTSPHWRSTAKAA